MKSSLILSVAGCFLWAVQCATPKHEYQRQSLIEYPQPLPDSVALIFLPGIISIKDSFEFNAVYAPDGKSIYFSRANKYLHDIYVTTWNGEMWSPPAIAPFAINEYAEGDPFFGPNGKLYFISNRPTTNSDTTLDFDIWSVSNQENGTWSEPENVKVINSDSAEYYVTIADNGNLYFASNRQGGFGSHDIYVSKLLNGNYFLPENLGTSINAVEMEHDPFISKDEQTLFFTSVDRVDSFGSADIYYSVRDENGHWTNAKNLGKTINTPTYDFCSFLSGDSKYFFYASEKDVKWISADIVFQRLK
jgi:Tol biopolymer transport system component